MRLIDGDEAIEKVQDIEPIFIFKVSEVIATQRTSDVIAMLENAPTIEAEPVKTGKWISREVDHTEHMVADGTQTAKCSVCGKYHTTPYLYFFKDYAYCPNCGARMEEEEC